MDCHATLSGFMQRRGRISHLDVLRCGIPIRSMSVRGLGCAKTKSDLVVMPSGRQIFAFFCSPHERRAQNSGCGYTAYSFYTWGNSGLRATLRLGESALQASTRPTSWGLAIMEADNGTLRRTRRVAEADSNLHRGWNRKGPTRRDCFIRPGGDRGVYQIVCAERRPDRPREDRTNGNVAM